MQEVSLVDVSAPAIDQLQERLRPKLMSLSRDHVLGSQLGPLIDQSLEPGARYRDFFPTGTMPRLRTFVERFLEGLVVPTDQKQGSDFLYEILGSTPFEMPYEGGRLWKSFVAVDPTQKLIFDSSIAAIKVAPLAVALPDGCSDITPVGLDEHRQLCIDFISDLEARGRGIGALKDVAASYTERSYPQWLKILRTQEPPLDGEWGQFRHARLLGVFRQRLNALGVPETRIPQLVTELERDRLQASPRPKKIGKAAPQDATAVDTTVSKEKRARELLHLVIDRLDFDQLQKIQLPFGALFDLLGSDRQ